MAGPQLQATLSFTIEDLEELISSQVRDNGYIMQDLTWDEGQASARVRPMTPEERTAHELPTVPVEDRISSAVQQVLEIAMGQFQALMDERNALRDELRMLNAKLEGLSATIVSRGRSTSDSVVQEHASPNNAPEPDDDSSNIVSLKTAIEEEVGDGLTKKEREDRAAYLDRLRRIRQDLEEGNRHPDLPDANKRLRSDHEFDQLPEELRNT